MIERSEINELNLVGLANIWRELRAQKTLKGWATDSAVAKSSIERRLLELVQASAIEDSSFLECRLSARVKQAGLQLALERLRLYAGGVELPKSCEGLRQEGDAILEVLSEGGFPLRVKCRVGTLPSGAVALHFSEKGAAGERRVQRLLVELLESFEEN